MLDHENAAGNTPADASRANDFRLAGRVAGDAVYRGLDGRRVIQFRLAVEKDYRDVSDRDEKQTTFVPVAVGGTAGEFLQAVLAGWEPDLYRRTGPFSFLKTPDGRSTDGIALRRLQGSVPGPGKRPAIKGRKWAIDSNPK